MTKEKTVNLLSIQNRQKLSAEFTQNFSKANRHTILQKVLQKMAFPRQTVKKQMVGQRYLQHSPERKIQR